MRRWGGLALLLAGCHVAAQYEAGPTIDAAGGLPDGGPGDVAAEGGGDPALALLGDAEQIVIGQWASFTLEARDLGDVDIEISAWPCLVSLDGDANAAGLQIFAPETQQATVSVHVFGRLSIREDVCRLRVRPAGSDLLVEWDLSVVEPTYIPLEGLAGNKIRGLQVEQIAPLAGLVRPQAVSFAGGESYLVAAGPPSTAGDADPVVQLFRFAGSTGQVDALEPLAQHVAMTVDDLVWSRQGPGGPGPYLATGKAVSLVDGNGGLTTVYAGEARSVAVLGQDHLNFFSGIDPAVGTLLVPGSPQEVDLVTDGAVETSVQVTTAADEVARQVRMGLGFDQSGVRVPVLYWLDDATAPKLRRMTEPTTEIRRDAPGGYRPIALGLGMFGEGVFLAEQSDSQPGRDDLVTWVVVQGQRFDTVDLLRGVPCARFIAFHPDGAEAMLLAASGATVDADCEAERDWVAYRLSFLRPGP